jgi:hypothetical protein
MRNRRLGQRLSTAVPLIGLGQGFRGSRLNFWPGIRFFGRIRVRGDCDRHSIPENRPSTGRHLCSNSPVLQWDLERRSRISIVPLPLTLNVEPGTCEPLQKIVTVHGFKGSGV